MGDTIVAFSTRYPKIRIRFEVGGMSERAYDFLDQGFDVAFHTRHVRDSNLLLRKIADLNFMLCASPTYLHRAGRPTQVTELTERDCLMNTNDPIWHLKHAGHDVHLKISDPVYSSNSYLTLRKAALAGRGVGLLPVRLISASSRTAAWSRWSPAARCRTGRSMRCTPPAARPWPGSGCSSTSSPTGSAARPRTGDPARPSRRDDSRDEQAGG